MRVGDMYILLSAYSSFLIITFSLMVKSSDTIMLQVFCIFLKSSETIALVGAASHELNAPPTSAPKAQKPLPTNCGAPIPSPAFNPKDNPAFAPFQAPVRSAQTTFARSSLFQLLHPLLVDCAFERNS